MDKLWYLDNLKRKLEPYYDLEEAYVYDGYHSDLYARFFSKDARYIASRNVVIYSIEKNQHIFVKYVPHVGLNEVQHMIRHLDKVAKDWVTPSEDHMSTFVRGILITDGAIDRVAAEQAKKYKGEKSFFFGIRGWVYNGINVMDLNDPSNFVHNRRGKEDLTFFTV